MDCTATENALKTHIESQEKMCEERFARDKERIDRIEEKFEDISTCNTKLTCLIEKYDGILDAHEDRLKALEQRPNAWFDKFITAIISTGISIIVTFIISNILY